MANGQTRSRNDLPMDARAQYARAYRGYRIFWRSKMGYWPALNTAAVSPEMWNLVSDRFMEREYKPNGWAMWSYAVELYLYKQGKRLPEGYAKHRMERWYKAYRHESVLFNDPNRLP